MRLGLAFAEDATHPTGLHTKGETVLQENPLLTGNTMEDDSIPANGEVVGNRKCRECDEPILTSEDRDVGYCQKCKDERMNRRCVSCGARISFTNDANEGRCYPCQQRHELTVEWCRRCEEEIDGDGVGGYCEACQNTMARCCVCSIPSEQFAIDKPGVCCSCSAEIDNKRRSVMLYLTKDRVPPFDVMLFSDYPKLLSSGVWDCESVGIAIGDSNMQLPVGGMVSVSEDELLRVLMRNTMDRITYEKRKAEKEESDKRKEEKAEADKAAKKEAREAKRAAARLAVEAEK